jgi:hypothetical protein
LRSAISSRAANDRYRPESGLAEHRNIAGGMPPAFRNNLYPTGCDTPASSAAASLLSPAAIPRQNLLCSSRPATCGRPGDGNGARPDLADLRPRILIATSNVRVLRRPLESAQYASAEYRKLVQSAGFRASMSRKADCYTMPRSRASFTRSKPSSSTTLTMQHAQRPHVISLLTLKASTIELAVTPPSAISVRSRWS